MSGVLELLRAEFVQHAVLTALMVAVVCAYLGVFVVLKRIVFVGAALAESSGFGAALAFFPPVVVGWEKLVGAVPALAPLDHYRPLALALVFMLLAVAFFAQQRLGRRLPREAIIGAVYASAVGLTLLTASQNASGAEHIDEVLNGSIITVMPTEMIELAVVAGVIMLIQALFYKEFVLVSFDPEVARTLGYRSSRWELLWYLMLGLMIAVSIHVAGTVLVFAYLVLPAVTALLLSRRMPVVLALSVLFAVLATFVGVLASLSSSMPTSYAIVGCSAALFGICWIGNALGSLVRAKA